MAPSKKTSGSCGPILQDGYCPRVPDKRSYQVRRTPPAAALAGLLLAARMHLKELGLQHPSAAEILAATGATRSQAYARCAMVRGHIAFTRRGPGRPRSRDAGGVGEAEVTRCVLTFLMDHPGAVGQHARKRAYSGAFRRFLLELRSQHPHLGSKEFARAVQVPSATLSTWRRQPPRIGVPATAPAIAPIPHHGPMAMVAHAWQQWHGSLTRFCEHIQRDLGIAWNRGTAARRLAVLGLRAPRPRARRRVDTRAPRGSFINYFPGAQWVSDGSKIDIYLNQRRFRFNLQLVVDTASAAVLGASVRDREDGQAVLSAFRDAVATAGKPPLALLLDQRACNRSAEVEQLRRETSLLYAARGRPQSKAHVEGGFGLFSRALPSLRIDADEPRELARQVVTLLVQCWARTLNHRSRSQRCGRTRVALYRESRASPVARRAAQEALGTRAAHAYRSPHRRRPRRNSELRDFLRHAIERLGISDQDRYVETVLGSYRYDTIVASLAVYQGKRDAGTLPTSADGRYLLGIARRIAEREEGIAIGQALWQVRTSAQAHLHAAIEAHKQTLLRQECSPESVLDALVDEALATTSDVEERYWVMVLAEAIRQRPDQQASLYRRAVRRIHTFPRVPY